MILRRLNAEEQGALRVGLDLAAELAASPLPLSRAQVQALYDDALEGATDDDERLIAIGLAFGDLISREDGFEWARISDQYGDETCVAVIGSMTHCAPISMIQKRIRRNEAVDIGEMADSTMNLLREQARLAAPRGSA